MHCAPCVIFQLSYRQLNKHSAEHEVTGRPMTAIEFQQDAQLSHRDPAAGCVIILDKSGRLELADNILRTLQVYLRPL